MVVIPAWPVFMDWRALKTSTLVLSRGEGGQSVKQRACVKQSACTVLDLQIKAGGDERLRALAALAVRCRNGQHGCTRAQFQRQPTNWQAAPQGGATAHLLGKNIKQGEELNNETVKYNFNSKDAFKLFQRISFYFCCSAACVRANSVK